MEYLHTMVRVTDLPQSLDFFTNKLGLVETRRVDNEAGRFTLVFLSAPGDLDRAAKSKAPLIELTYNWDKEAYTAAATSAIWPMRSRIFTRHVTSS